MHSTTETLPLFPLHAVLLPGAGLDLRVFERRYLDPVSYTHLTLPTTERV